MHDIESPVQDADIETAQLQATGRRIARLKSQGVCAHSWVHLRAGTETHPVKCNECGKLFKSEEELDSERRELLDL